MKRIDISQYVLTINHTTPCKGLFNAMKDSYMKNQPFELVFDFDNHNYVYVGGASYDHANPGSFAIPFLDWYQGTQNVLIVDANDGTHVREI